MRVRISTRRVMVLIAFVALAMEVGRAVERGQEYRRRAGFHRWTLKTLELVRTHGCYPHCSLGLEDLPLVYDRVTAPRHARFVAYHSQMEQKYRRATWRPWLTVDPDPPRPE